MVKDFCSQQVEVGDWLVLPSSSSNQNPFRFMKVMKFGSTGKPLGPSFEFFTIDQEWGQRTQRLTVHACDKAWRINESQLPQSLKDYIRDEHGGDPTSIGKTVAARKAAQ